MLVKTTATSASAAGIATTLAALRTATGTDLVRIVEAADGKINLVSGAYTKQVRLPFSAGDFPTLELVVRGAGTTNGSALVYVGADNNRKLLAAKSGLDLSAGTIGRAFASVRSGLTLQKMLVTTRGSQEIVDEDHKGQPIYQGYVSINSLNVVNRDVGIELEEIVVRPGEENTWAVRITTENCPAGCQPFIVALYNDAGDRYVATRLFGPDGVPEGNTPWEDRAVFFTPRAGFHRCRIENDKMDGGTYIVQQPLRSPKRLDTVEARDAERAKPVSVKGEAETLLSGFVPSVGVGVVNQDYEEEWLRLHVKADEPQGDPHVATADAATDRITSDDHGFAAGGTVRVVADSSGTLPGGLVPNKTYFVNTPTGSSFSLAAAEGGAIVNLTSSGSGFSVYGVTSVDAVFRSTNADPPTNWESTWNYDPDAIPQDKKWVNVYLTLCGDGVLWPTVSPGGVELTWKTWQPSMHREDGSPFPGGATVFGLIRLTEDSERDTTPVAGRARARRLNDPLPRYDTSLEVDFYHPKAFEEFMSDPYAVRLVDHPAANVSVLIKPYEVGEPSYYETELFEEQTGFLSVTVPITRLEAIEVADLVPAAELEVGA